MFNIPIAELIRMIRAVSEEEALDRILIRQLATIRELIHFQRGYFLCFEGENLVVKAECHLENDMQTELCSIPCEGFPHLSQSFIQRVARTRKPLLLEQPAEDPRFADDPYFRENEVKVVLGLPLLCNQRWIGLVYLQNGPAGGTFPPDRVQFLGALSEPMAIALEKAMRLSSLSARYKTLQRELTQLRQKELDQNLRLAIAFSDQVARAKAKLTAHLLHKVGNEINSLGLLRELVYEQFEESKVKKLFQATALIAEHKDQMASFMTEDPRGKLLAPYLLEVEASLKKERRLFRDDLQKMGEQFESIRELLVRLRDQAQRDAELTALDPLRLTEDILNLECGRLPHGTVPIEKTFDPCLLLVRVSRSNLVFILKYLIKKTIEALEPLPPKQRRLQWSIEEEDRERVRLVITDGRGGGERRPLAKIIEQGPGKKDDAFYSGLRKSIGVMEALGCKIDIMSDGHAGFALLLPRAEEP